MKVKLFATLAALLLVACSSDSDMVNTETQERGVVKTEFTISFPQNLANLTRLSSDVVQVAASGNLVKFRGIKNIRLYPFEADSANVSSNSTYNELNRINLYGSGTVNPAGYSGGTNEIASQTVSGTTVTSTPFYKNSVSHLYQNVDIPTGTKSFIFYGEAAAAATSTADSVGALRTTTPTGTATLKDIAFSPQPIFSSAATSVGESGDSIAEYLTSIANTEITYRGETKTWADTKNVGLQQLYQNYILLTTGSWANVKAVVGQMYKNLQTRVEDNDETKAMKVAIRNSIAQSGYGVNRKGDSGEDTLQLTFSKTYRSYPASIKLPDGAAIVAWETPTGESANRFVAKVGPGSTGLDVSDLSSFAYPASLYYYVLSNITTSDQEKNAYNDDDTWTTITNTYHSGNEVKYTTRSVAVLRPVQYAVARLDVIVKANAETLPDNSSPAQNIAVRATTFPITGLLVGGQKAVGYNFQQRTDSTKLYTVYDNQVQNDNGSSRYLNSIGFGEGGAIHTMLLETAAATAKDDANSQVKIAVEFLNNGTQTIVGQGGCLIYPGCKFYLIGTLNPWKEEAQPDRLKALEQDYTTTANLTVSGLSSAYASLPDLSVPKLEMGLSVDLTWKNGLTQDITID